VRRERTHVRSQTFILTARVTQDANDTAQLTPTARTTRTDLDVGTMIGDTDDNLTVDGPDRLIADAKRHIIDRRAAQWGGSTGGCAVPLCAANTKRSGSPCAQHGGCLHRHAYRAV
jgi:hypothetical protein